MAFRERCELVCTPQSYFEILGLVAGFILLMIIGLWCFCFCLVKNQMLDVVVMIRDDSLHSFAAILRPIQLGIDQLVFILI